MTIQDAWERLHHQVLRLYPHATFNYAGMVQPNLIVSADVLREDVTVTISFEVKDNGWIEFPDNGISNMLSRQEIYDHYFAIDPRIPPLAEYIEEDTRPYHTGTPICFYLKAHLPITDRSDERPGRLGGDNGTGIQLPGIKYGARPINTTDPSEPKVSGSLKATPGTMCATSESEEDSSPTDSAEDESGEAHRLARISLALHNREPVMVVFVGHFQGYQDIQAQCEFRLNYSGLPPPSLKDFFEFNWSRIRDAAPNYGSTSVPESLLWTIQSITDDSLNISVYRFGMGLKVRHAPKDIKGLEMEKWPAVFTFDLEDGISIAFPAVQRLPDALLMQYVVNLTVPWDGHEYGSPWHVFLTQQPCPKSETGEIFLQALAQYPADVNPEAFNPRVPFNSAQERDFSEITSARESSRTLKFGRDSGWPMLLSCASSLDGLNPITVTYETSLADCEDSIPWFLNKFNELMAQDGLIGLPAAARLGITWKQTWQIEDFKVHIFITEMGVSTPEDDGPPCFIFCGPKASLKLRCESTEVAMRAVTMCYGRGPAISEQDCHHTKEWALIAPIFGDIVDDKHKFRLERHVETEESATFNKETFVTGLATHPYRTGLGKFAVRFKPDERYSATIAIEEGVHGEHGTAIFFEQENRRCLLARRLYGIPDEDALWYVMRDWAQFKPRLSKPRVDPASYSSRPSIHMSLRSIGMCSTTQRNIQTALSHLTPSVR
jgi:hypothetical protein